MLVKFTCLKYIGACVDRSIVTLSDLKILLTVHLMQNARQIVRSSVQNWGLTRGADIIIYKWNFSALGLHIKSQSQAGKS